MHIRRATLDDLNAIEPLWKEMALFHQNLDPYFTIIPEAEARHRSYMRALLQDDSKRILVADDGANLLGYIMAEINVYPPIYEYPKYGHIGAISVSQTARRQGVGRKLLDVALDWFREQGLQRVECAVAVQNSISQGFWKGAGFRGFMEQHVFDL